VVVGINTTGLGGQAITVFAPRADNPFPFQDCEAHAGTTFRSHPRMLLLSFFHHLMILAPETAPHSALRSGML